MKTASHFLILAGAVLGLSMAAQSEEKVPAYELKSRSVFDAQDDARIPFWPIGFQRPKIRQDGTAAPVAAPSKIQLAADDFRVTSILLGNPALATINGHSFEEGEVLPVIFGTERLRVVVRAIRDGGVTLEYADQRVTVPMRRPELGQKHTVQKRDAADFTILIGAPKQK